MVLPDLRQSPRQLCDTLMYTLGEEVPFLAKNLERKSGFAGEHNCTGDHG